MKKNNETKMKYNIVFGMLFLGILMIQGKEVQAAPTPTPPPPVTINEVDYDDENLVIDNHGNKKIYFATEIEAAKDNWEVIEADLNADSTIATTTTIDLSWLSPSIENILMIRGEDEDAAPARVIIVERTRKLEVSISYAAFGGLLKSDSIATLLNIMTTEGSAENPITYNDLEWKKGDGGKWKAISELTVGQLEKYQIKGTYLYFRIKADNDDASDITLKHPFTDGTKGRRASSDVKVKIAKKVSPMVIGVDGEEFTAEIKYGKEYQVTFAGVTKKWKPVTDRAVKFLSLSEILNDSSKDGTVAANALPEMLIEIRDYSTAKTAASKITEIALEAQRIVTGSIFEKVVPVGTTSADKDIYVYYNGIKNMVITVPSATVDEPYEYCIVKPDDFFDLQRVVWTSITKGSGIKILATKAVEGGTLYVRMKEIKSKEATRTTLAVGYALASTYVSTTIKYPSIPKITSSNFTFTKGYSNSIVFNIPLNTLGKNPFETVIKSIKLGTRDIAFDQALVEVILDTTKPTEKLYSITVTLKDTSLITMTNCFARLITINFVNGTIDKTSVKLTIQSPTQAYSLTATAAKATTTVGSTKVTVVSALGSGNSFVYAISDTVVTNINLEDKIVVKAPTFTAITPEIAITAGKYLTIYEINSGGFIIKFKSILITTDLIL